eukprot:s164_g56.t1
MMKFVWQLRRARLRHLATLHRCEATVSWAALHDDDDDWCALVRDDLSWLWRQVQHCTTLADPTTGLAAWRCLWRYHPNYWKRLVKRAFLHAGVQRKNDLVVRKTHWAILDLLTKERHILPGPLPHDDPTLRCSSQTFGCMSCAKAFRSRGDEGAHMFRCHKEISYLRWLFDGTACPACLREYHPFGRLKAHLHYSRDCRTRLLNRPRLSAPAAGVGSVEHETQERRLNGLLPPLPGAGPHLCDGPQREIGFFDIDLYAILVDIFMDAPIESHSADLRAAISARPISWSSCTATLQALRSTASEDDAAAFGYESLAALHALLDALASPSSWAFLGCPDGRKVVPEIYDLETAMAHSKVHRLVLHAFSRRRRPGDFQEFLDAIVSSQSGIVVHVVSVGIILGSTWGGVTDVNCQQFWYEGVRPKYVIGYLAGPPCETWSQAREKGLPADDGADMTRPGPRVLCAMEEIWGQLGLVVKEVRQLLTGNQLMLFSFHMVLLLYLSGGCIGAPSPTDSASIWRTATARGAAGLPACDLCKRAPWSSLNEADIGFDTAPP